MYDIDSAGCSQGRGEVGLLFPNQMRIIYTVWVAMGGDGRAETGIKKVGESWQVAGNMTRHNTAGLQLEVNGFQRAATGASGLG